MTAISESHRAALMDVADVLVPPTDVMPSLRDADPSGDWLERACVARADLVTSLSAILDDLDRTDLPSVLASLHADDRPRFDVLATFVAGTYYMIPRIRELIGYPGQVRNAPPLDLAADELDDEIFEGAVNYARSYRQPPN